VATAAGKNNHVAPIPKMHQSAPRRRNEDEAPIMQPFISGGTVTQQAFHTSHFDAAQVDSIKSPLLLATLLPTPTHALISISPVLTESRDWLDCQ